MHLLDVRTRKLKYFAGEVPSYAILSHTWGDDEISFQDIKNAGVEQRAGYLKIKKTCELAAGLQLNYIWVDTCCIDKSSSTELSEAINSMYQWYQDATVCYAYLSDVDINVSSRRESDDQVSNSRYFTRGWTLQEILAPWTVIFLDMHWREMGTRETLRNTLTAITRIPAKFLSGEDLGKASIAQRMSWASHRTTTRFEDRAYSLLGIFGLSMPLLYGEGQKAFIRLQEEIINNIDDYSIFAWTLPGTGSADVLSPSPEGFHYSRGIIPDDSIREPDEAIIINSKGIHLQAKILEGPQRDGSVVAILPCEWECGGHVGIHVKALWDTEVYFTRSSDQRLESIDSQQLQGLRSRKVCIQRRYETRNYQQSQLAQAAADGNINVLQLLLQSGWDPDHGFYRESSPLANAAMAGHENAVQVLLQYGALKDRSDGSGNTPLGWAATNGQEHIVRLLLRSGARVDSQGFSPLRLAVSHGHDHVVRLLLEAGAQVNQPDFHGNTPLGIAASRGHDHVVRLLLESGAQVDQLDPRGNTPLGLAASEAHHCIVKLLLESGAQVNQPDSHGDTPLEVAACNGHDQVVRLLLEYGAQANRPGSQRNGTLGLAVTNEHDDMLRGLRSDGGSPSSVHDVKTTMEFLFRVVRRRQAGVVDALLEALLDKGADPDYVVGDSRTAVRTTRDLGKEAVAPVLLKRADLDYWKDSSCQSLLSVAVSEYGDLATVKVLLNHGANIESRGRLECTPLNVAAWLGHAEMVELLLERGADKEGLNFRGHGETPLSNMAKQGDLRMVKMLLEAGADRSISKIHDETPFFLAWSVGSRGRNLVKLFEDCPARARKRPSDDDDALEEPTPRKRPKYARSVDNEEQEDPLHEISSQSVV